MCKKTIQVDCLHSCLGEESADTRFGIYLAHSKQDTRYNASHVFFLSKGDTRLGFIYFSVLSHLFTKYFNAYLENSYRVILIVHDLFLLISGVLPLFCKI